MNQTFHFRNDWIESKLTNETRSAILGASVVVALSIGVWWFAKSWIPLAICALGLAFAISVFARMSHRRKVFSSLALTASETGLTFGMPGDDRELFYPWATITYRVNTAKAKGEETITIGKEGQPGAELGLENMDELITLLEDNSGDRSSVT